MMWKKLKEKKKTRRRKRTKENESAFKKDYKCEEKRENVCERRIEIVKKKKKSQRLSKTRSITFPKWDK